MTGSIFPKSELCLLFILSMCFARLTRSHTFTWFPTVFFKYHPWAEENHVGGPNDQQPNGDFAKTSKGIQPDAGILLAMHLRKKRKNTMMLRDSSTSTIGKRKWIMLCHSGAYLRFSFSLLMSFKIHLSADTAKSTGTKTNQRSLRLVYITNKLDNSPKQGPSPPPKKKNVA